MSRIVPVLKKLFVKCGFNHILKPVYAGYGTILCFHQIYPPDYLPELQKRINDSSFTPDQLETVLEWFSRQGYSFVSMDDIPELLKKGRRKYVALTFDDGYRDNMLFALPVLRKFNAPMTIYASSGWREDNLVPWIFLLDRLIAESTEISYGTANTTTLPCRSAWEKKTAFSQVLDHVLAHESGQLQALREIVGDMYDIAPYADLIMTEDELVNIDRDSLVSIGAHGISHSSLATLKRDAARREITESKTSLENLLGHPVCHLAYPYGGPKHASARDFQLATETGFSTAVTLRHAHIFPAHADIPTALPRINISPAIMHDPSLIGLYAHGFTAMKSNRGKRIITV